MDVGTLGSRPSVPGSTGDAYFATDDRGGTLWVGSSGVWLQASPSVDEASSGQRIASASPTSIAAISIPQDTSTPYQVPELTTAPFTLPARPVLAHTSVLGLAGLGAASPGSYLQLRYTKDGGLTWSLAEHRALLPGTAAAFWVEYTWSLSVEIPYAGATSAAALTPGDTVQVGLFIVSDRDSGGSKSFTVVRTGATGVNPYLWVVTG